MVDPHRDESVNPDDLLQDAVADLLRRIPERWAECDADTLTPPARNHFRARAKFTTNLASINSNDLREMPLPLPPLARQRELADKVANRRAEIAALRTAAAERAQQAEADVEAMILGAKAVT